MALQYPYSSADPYFDNVSLLLQFNGPTGTGAYTDIVDRSLNNLVPTGGNAVIETGGPEATGGGAPGTAGAIYQCLNLPSNATTNYTYVTYQNVQGGPLDLCYGGGDFTVECFVWCDGSALEVKPWNAYNNSNNDSAGLYIFNVVANGTTASATANFWWATASNNATTSPTITLNVNSWNHIALVYTNGALNLYVNGVSAGSLAVPATNAFTSQGSLDLIENFTDPGTIAEYRITKGVARYTSNFSVPSAPFPALQIAANPLPAPYLSDDPYFGNVALLLHFNGASTGPITDSSLQGLVPYSTADLTLVPGGPEATGGGAPGVAGAVYQCLEFQGTTGNDEIFYHVSPLPLTNPPTNAGLDLTSTLSDFTVEFFLNCTSGGVEVMPLFLADSLTSPNGHGANLAIGSTASGGSTLPVLVTLLWGAFSTPKTKFYTSLAVGAWNHWALVRKDGVLTIYLNGTSLGSLTTTETWYSSSNSASVPLISSNQTGNPTYLAEYRITNGVARYTANFTPPTGPFPDATMNYIAPNDPTANSSPATVDPYFADVLFLGNPASSNYAQGDGISVEELINGGPEYQGGLPGSASSSYQAISGTLAFPGEPVNFAGNANYPATPYVLPLTAYATSTVEFWMAGTSTDPYEDTLWFYYMGVVPQQGQVLFKLTSVYDKGVPHVELQFLPPGGSSTDQINTVIPVNPFVWNHFAFVVENNVFTAYANGQEVYSYNGIGFPATPWYDEPPPSAPPSSWSLVIDEGTSSPIYPQKPQTYISNLRITKNIARYTANFVPPIAPLPAQGPRTVVTVPNVVGQDITTATTNLSTAGAVITEYNQEQSKQPAGTVLSTYPPAGTVIPAPGLVAVTLSQGEPVPTVIGESLSQAQLDLNNAGFVLGLITYEFNMSAPSGRVIGQSPLGFEDFGGAVYLTVSKGPRPAVIPDLTLMTAQTANNAIEAAGLTLGTVVQAASDVIPAGEIITQDPPPYTFAAWGSMVRYTISVGPTQTASGFDYTQTMLSQYANSPILNRLIANVTSAFDPSANLQNFYDYYWNIYTAEGVGLDILGRIVNVAREIQVPVSSKFTGFKDSLTPGDWQPLGQAPWRSAYENVTNTYTLPDAAYRVLILVKAMANISDGSARSLNALVSTLFAGRGKAYVQDTGNMTMNYVFEFQLTNTELAIVSQSGAFPHPAGVAVSIVINAPNDYLSFQEASGNPFGSGVFYVPPVV